MTTEGKVTTIKHSLSGSTCRIHAHGATVLSFRTGGDDGTEHLFVSRDAVLDGSKPIRGGIPLVFPIFGPPPKKDGGSTMPQHGFARVNEWKLEKTYDEEVSAGATYTLQLSDVTAGRGDSNPWSVEQATKDGTDCLLTYDVRVEEKELICTLVVKNTGSSSFDFNVLFHTYFAVHGQAAGDPAKTNISGLGGYAITDKVSGDSGHVQSYDDPVTVQGETDQVFIHPDDHPTIHAKVSVGGDKPLRLESGGQVDECPVPVSCVVWNPGKDKAVAMADFGDDQYQDMICVEPGLVGHQPLLAPGKEARLTQSINIG